MIELKFTSEADVGAVHVWPAITQVREKIASLIILHTYFPDMAIGSITGRVCISDALEVIVTAGGIPVPAVQSVSFPDFIFAGKFSFKARIVGGRDRSDGISVISRQILIPPSVHYPRVNTAPVEFIEQSTKIGIVYC
ncbi:MAG: hypothetical protein ACP5F3_06920, partial [Candidatus Syntrophosphaera sp.]